MIDSRSREAVSGVRLVQKYCNALRPITGMPSSAKTFEISRSMAAHPPSPETKTISVSEVPRADDDRREERPRGDGVQGDGDGIVQLVCQRPSRRDRMRRDPRHDGIDQSAHDDGDVDDLQVAVVAVHGDTLQGNGSRGDA